MYGDDALNDRLSEEQIESLKVVWDDPGQILGFPDASQKASDRMELGNDEPPRETQSPRPPA